MKIKNLSIKKSAMTILMTGAIALTTLTGCNKQIIDYNKNFNVAVEPNGNNISVMGISSYNDYTGAQVLVYTESGLVILSSTYQLQLLHVDSRFDLDNYISYIANYDDTITYHDDNMGSEIHYGVWNKNIIDLKYLFNKAMILRDDNTVSIVDISSWRDYEQDDKIQLTLTDGTVILTEITKVKLIDDTKALDGALIDYATSLVESADNVYYNGEQIKTK